MLEIVPSLLVEDEATFKERLNLVKDDCKTVQLDILNDSLFHNTTWFDAKRVGDANMSQELELHLMVENPIPIVEDFLVNAPALKRVIVHAEMHRPLAAVVSKLKEHEGLGVGVAVNPETPLSAIEDVMHQIDQLTIMSVHPGFSGQTFGDEQHVGDSEVIFTKIERALAHRPELSIEIDGGVTDELIEPLVRTGVQRVCAASLIYKNENPTKKLKELNEKLANIN